MLNSTVNIQKLQHILYPLLAPFSWIYAAILYIRRRISASNPDFTPPIPCISVGNIAWGGTGKTPIVDFLLNFACKKHYSATVLTRGYKTKNSKLPVEVISTSLPSFAGDEPLMLKKKHPEASVIVDPVRIRAAKYALAHCNPRFFILDDGFQHIRMGRHLNLVLLRPEDLTDQWNRVIPAGSWREGSTALAYADAFLMKADNNVIQRLTPHIESKLKVFGKPFFSFSLKAEMPRRVSGKGCPPSPYILVSGVGNPKNVRTTASRLLKAAPQYHAVFPDHHTYTEKDAKKLAQYTLPVLCTEKDADKLAPFGLNLWSMPVEPYFGIAMWSQDNTFETWLSNWFDTFQ